MTIFSPFLAIVCLLAWNRHDTHICQWNKKTPPSFRTIVPIQKSDGPFSAELLGKNGEWSFIISFWCPMALESQPWNLHCPYWPANWIKCPLYKPALSLAYYSQHLITRSFSQLSCSALACFTVPHYLFHTELFYNNHGRYCLHSHMVGYSHLRTPWLTPVHTRHGSPSSW